ncbi:MAG: M6 family metalloprotease domain-containing protein [Prevotella sp.]|nr:M6 family metalloprotease domain-containing protein [Prevotella sp.]
MKREWEKRIGWRCMMFVAFLCMAVQLFAEPAKPGLKRTLTLTDGSTVVAQLVGDEFGHYWLADNGKAYWATDATRLYREVDKQAIQKRAAKQRNEVYERRCALMEARNGKSRRVGTIMSGLTGKKKGLLILVNFSDVSFGAGHTRDVFNDIVNKKNYTEGSFKGSVYDYFYAQSRNEFELTFDVVGPVTLSQTRWYYGHDSSDSYNVNAREMISEACSLVDNDVDFSDYDWDGDGVVDLLYVIYAGEGQADGGSDETVWPHSWDFPEDSRPKHDNKDIVHYACGPELKGGTTNLKGIGTMCHETSHVFGFPDFYNVDYTGGNHPHSWDIMAGGSYNDDGYQPPCYTSYELNEIGWGSIMEIETSTKVWDVKSIAEGGRGFLIRNDANENEYFLLENRQKTGWDAGLPGSGLLIFRVNYDADVWRHNKVNVTTTYHYTDIDRIVPGFMRMALMPTTKSVKDKETDAWPSNNVDFFSKNTPGTNTMFYNNTQNGTKYSDYAVTDITQNSDGTMTFIVVRDGDGFKGTVSLTSVNPTPGSWVYYDLEGEVAQLKAKGAVIEAQWQRRSKNSKWINVEGNKTSSGEDVYQVWAEDVDQYLRVKISVEGYTGSIVSSEIFVKKNKNISTVVAPTLMVSNNQVRVTNPKDDQEYLIFNHKKDIASLTESDWENAKALGKNDAFLFLGGTKNSVNYVYTRKAETPTIYAGTEVCMASIYLGETIYTQNIEIEVKGIVQNGMGKPQYVDLPQEYGAYYCKVGEVLRIVASPIPADATNFNGIYYDNWINNSKSGTFYADRACTSPLLSGQSYKTVYFKPTKQCNFADISAQFTKGYNDIARDAFSLHIADTNGNILANSISGDRAIVRKGEKKSGFDISTYPLKASLNNITISLNKGTGIAPTLTVDAESRTFSVDASSATKGTFYYNVSQKGNEVVGGFTVEVTTPAVEEVYITPSVITDAEPGQEYKLELTVFPAGVEENIYWTSNNTTDFPVDENGIVKVASTADIGASGTIFASVGDKTAFCDITVAGQKFDLWVAGQQVTTRNMDDILGDGKVTFDGVKTLTLNNATINAESSKPGVRFNQSGMVCQVVGDCYINSKENDGISLTQSIFISGDGKLTVSGGDCGIVFNELNPANVCLTIYETNVTAEGGKYGIYGGDDGLTMIRSLEVNKSTVKAKGGIGAVCNWTGGISMHYCSTKEPKGAEVFSEYIGTATTPATEVLILPEQETSIVEVMAEDNKDGWCMLNGTRLAKRPTTSGIYLHGGKKVVIK